MDDHLAATHVTDDDSDEAMATNDGHSVQLPQLQVSSYMYLILLAEKQYFLSLSNHRIH